MLRLMVLRCIEEDDDVEDDDVDDVEKEGRSQDLGPHFVRACQLR